MNIKPLTVNKAWQGRRFKTQEYLDYEKILMLILPKKIQISSGKLKLEIVAGFSYSGGDIDNIIKPFVDILQKKYSFNDNRIYRLIVDKIDVKKGEEYIDFKISKL